MLTNRKICVFAEVWRIEGEDNICFRDAKIYQLIGYANFCTVLLNPNFAIDNVKVKNNAIDSFGVAPTHIDELIMVMFGQI